MIYVTSDLHGLPLKELQALLKKAGFSTADWLYILGDVVDRRNDGGVEILRWLLVQDNAQLILGNHEAMLLACDFVFEEITEHSIARLSPEKWNALQLYLRNGGEATLEAMQKLLQSDPSAAAGILEYLQSAPLYEPTEAGGRDFLLCHAGLGDFRPDKKLSQYTPEEWLWTRPRLTDVYFPDFLTIFGHTPTRYYGSEYAGKILRTDTWIDIDVGLVSGASPVLLRLDDLEEIYL